MRATEFSCTFEFSHIFTLRLGFCIEKDPANPNMMEDIRGLPKVVIGFSILVDTKNLTAEVLEKPELVGPALGRALV